MTTNTATITIIRHCITCQVDTPRSQSNGKCKICLKRYAANYRAINRDGKMAAKGVKRKEQAARNKLIIADHEAGASHDFLADKHNLSISYISKLCVGYVRPDRVASVELKSFGECNLYGHHDRGMMLCMNHLHGVAGMRVSADWAHRKGLSL